MVTGGDRREGTWLIEIREGLVAESLAILLRRAVVARGVLFEFASSEHFFNTADREVDIKRPIVMDTRDKSSATLTVRTIVSSLSFNGQKSTNCHDGWQRRWGRHDVRQITMDCSNMNKSEQDTVVGIGKYARRTSLRWKQ